MPKLYDDLPNRSTWIAYINCDSVEDVDALESAIKIVYDKVGKYLPTFDMHEVDWKRLRDKVSKETVVPYVSVSTLRNYLNVDRIHAVRIHVKDEYRKVRSIIKNGDTDTIVLSSRPALYYVTPSVTSAIWKVLDWSDPNAKMELQIGNTRIALKNMITIQGTMILTGNNVDEVKYYA